ncbi:exported hypothetical protein [uncultured Mycobacterium sp.]|uniref:Uncharacterized protein n=1 Tax=uncultured Mycobacterium sp. TaxID=171292 RepID=A0A1Y5P6I4_9MYCO|nr:exported hypothetical protein [uncultured Mycobacterium sp.]
MPLGGTEGSTASPMSASLLAPGVQAREDFGSLRFNPSERNQRLLRNQPIPGIDVRICAPECIDS